MIHAHEQKAFLMKESIEDLMYKGELNVKYAMSLYTKHIRLSMEEFIENPMHKGSEATYGIEACMLHEDMHTDGSSKMDLPFVQVQCVLITQKRFLGTYKYISSFTRGKQ